MGPEGAPLQPLRGRPRESGTQLAAGPGCAAVSAGTAVAMTGMLCRVLLSLVLGWCHISCEPLLMQN